MANINDYLDWRGDITFAESPFNEVDNLILSVLSYLDFEGIVPAPFVKEGPKAVAIGTANREYQDHQIQKEMTAFSDSFDSQIPVLLDKAAHSRRFRATKLTNYVERTDAEKDKQMAAVTFLLEDGTKYISFRGTDDTLTGWKEDFDLSFMDATAGQKDSLNYLNMTLRGNRRPLRIGGHSKGGNFAVYAAAYCQERIKKRILTVYSNDGPGFKKSIARSPEVESIHDRIRKFSPEYSAVGILLTSTVHAKLVQSDMQGVNQHNAFSWQVLGTKFVEADGRDPGSILFDRSMNMWIDGESEENRKLFVDTLFGMFMDQGVETLSEVTGNKGQTAKIVWNALREMPKDSRNKFLKIFMNLQKSRMVAGAEGLYEAGKLSLEKSAEKREARKEERAERAEQTDARGTDVKVNWIELMKSRIFHIEPGEDTESGGTSAGESEGDRPAEFGAGLDDLEEW
ncbi:MAG: Mbeg1-like protein [Eubacteriales bacterium]|jgi:hypothetical protein